MDTTELIFEGPIVRVAPNYYTIDDPSALRGIYGHTTKLIKSKWYDAWTFDPDPQKTNLFSERDPKKHGQMRRKVASIYTLSALLAYEPFVEDCIDLLCQKLEEHGSTTATIDVAYWLQCYAFDVIGEITVSVSLYILSSRCDKLTNIVREKIWILGQG